MDIIPESCNHNPREYCWCITKSKRQHLVGKSSPWAGEGNFLFILRGNSNLVIPTELIEEGEILLPCQCIKNFLY